jgi:hypothetical protein
MFRVLITLSCLALLAISPDVGHAQGKAKGHAVRSKSRVSLGVDIFIAKDRRKLRDYIANYPGGGLPAGLAKRKGALPPGLEKQLRRNGRLPPGLEKKISHFPPELERRLSPLVPGLRRGFIAGRAVIYNPKTSVIVDVCVPL